jgi:D-lactate dehydrogenase
MLTLSRKIFLSYDRIRETGSFDLDGLQGFDLKGKTLGVVGTGKIGRHVIRMAKGFEMDVIATDAYPDEKLTAEYGVKYVPFEELIATADIITFHVPELPSTIHMINMGNIGMIKKGAIIINTARGAIIETAALIRALNDGIVGGAGLDVFEEEVATKGQGEFLLKGRPEGHDLKTILENNLLIDMDNVIITPHNAFNTKEALQRILDTTVDNINSFATGTPKNEVKVG